ncbi:MAG: ATP-binding protein [Clostridiales bacterium]|nr:ATP-binding protein [Clostridiales bacterium]
MIGEPGCGKTMIARRVPTILPQMSEEGSLEVTKICSISGLLKNGYYPDARCRCTDYEMIKYRSKISGSILDRIDMQKEVKPVRYFQLEDILQTRTYVQLREAVQRARNIQQERYAGLDGVNTTRR